MKRILVAIDLQDETGKLINSAKELAKEISGELCVVHSESIENYMISNEFEHYPSLEIPKIMEIRKKSIEQKLSEIEKDLKLEGIKSTCILMDGSTAENILNEAEDFKADLIMLGSHKHGKFYNLIFGSLHDLLIKKTTIPVMIIPSGN